MTRILLDGKPGTVVDWTEDDGCKVVDLKMDDGTTRWTYWPSPRIEFVEDKLVRAADAFLAAVDETDGSETERRELIAVLDIADPT